MRKENATGITDPLKCPSKCLCDCGLPALHEKICACRLCDLAQERTCAVPGEGPTPARIMLIGEAPGREEDLTGRPFVGRAGRLLDQALAQAGVERSEVFITSIIKCRPPKNRKPKAGEIKVCLPYLMAQIEILKPDIVCLMGNVATGAVLGMNGIVSLRGQILHDRFLVTYHPAAVLRNINRMGDFVSDLKKAKHQKDEDKKDRL
jgi:uracil-DNA glycosylase